MMVQPLAGKAAGWPTPELEVITYLANKGVRLIGTDGPTLGGVDPAARHGRLLADRFARRRAWSNT